VEFDQNSLSGRVTGASIRIRAAMRGLLMTVY